MNASNRSKETNKKDQKNVQRKSLEFRQRNSLFSHKELFILAKGCFGGEKGIFPGNIGLFILAPYPLLADEESAAGHTRTQKSPIFPQTNTVFP